MTWQPMSREDLLAEMALAIDEADDSVRVAWERLRIEPEKWQCSPEGDEGGGFWAVGVTGSSVIWFNDIEGGFNRSPFTQRGVIGEYQCNQSDFGQLLDTLPEAVAAAGYADAKPSLAVPASLNGPGAIEERRTTYWVLRSDAGVEHRVHFSGKREHRVRSAAYAAPVLSAAHPVLADYHEARASLYVSGAEACDRSLLAELDACVLRMTKGWRPLHAYLAGAGTSILTGGGGLLMTGPESVATAAAEVVRAHGAKASVLTDSPAQPGYRVLLMADTFLVARSFRFEAVATRSPLTVN